MKILIVSDSECDFTEVLKSCGAETECICFGNVLKADFSKFDSFCILPEKSGDYLEARFREKLERQKREKGFSCRQFEDFRMFCAEIRQTARKAG